MPNKNSAEYGSMVSSGEGLEPGFFADRILEKGGKDKQKKVHNTLLESESLNLEPEQRRLLEPFVQLIPKMEYYAYKELEAFNLPTADAGDMVQQALINLLGNIRRGKYDPNKGTPRGYFVQLINGHVRNKFTSSKREGDILSKALHDMPLDALNERQLETMRKGFPNEMEDPHPNIEEVLATKGLNEIGGQNIELLKWAIARFPKDKKNEAYVLESMLNNRPVQEIAADLGVTNVIVGGIMNRAKNLAMKIISEKETKEQ